VPGDSTGVVDREQKRGFYFGMPELSISVTSARGIGNGLG